MSFYSFVLLCFVSVKLKMNSDTDSSTRTDKNFLAAYKTVFTKPNIGIFITSGVLTSFAASCYLTASSFVFMDIFKVSKFTFSILLTLNTGSLMLGNIVNSQLLTRFRTETVLRIGIFLGLFAASGLTIVNWLQLDYLYTMIFLMPLMGSLRIIAVNCDAIVFLKCENETGTATAVFQTLRYFCKASAGPILALLYTGTAVPFSAVMLISIIVIALMQPFTRHQKEK